MWWQGESIGFLWLCDQFWVRQGHCRLHRLHLNRTKINDFAGRFTNSDGVMRFTLLCGKVGHRKVVSQREWKEVKRLGIDKYKSDTEARKV